MVFSRNRMCSVAIAVLIAIVLSVPLGLSSDAQASEPKGAVETVLRIGSMQGVDSLNPFIGLNDMSYVFYGLVYDCLQGVGDDLSAAPNLAREWWAVSESDPELVMSGEPYGSVWQYNLTENARWTDGEPFTADDVIWNINLHAQNYEMMWSFQPYAYFISHATKVDDSTVRVHFCDRVTGDPKPVAYGSQMYIPMLPKHAHDWMDAGDLGFSWNGTPVIGTGPFMAAPGIYDEWIAGDTLTLLRNSDYHGLADYGQMVHFDKIQFRFFDEMTSLALALQVGQVDIAMLSPPAYLQIESDIAGGMLDDVATFDGVRPDNYFIHTLINMNLAGPNPSRLDPAVRTALSMSTNKSYIVDQFYFGLGEEGSTLVSPANEAWHYEPGPGEAYEYNKTVAADLLQSSGYIDTNADGIRECTVASMPVQEGWVAEGTPLTYEMMVRREYPEEKDVVQFLQADWADIGIHLTYQIMDEAELASRVYFYNYDMAVWYWSADPDPNYILFTQTESAWNGWSDTLYYSPAYEENYSAGVSELDLGARGAYVDNCQKVHYLDCPYLILSYPNQTVAWRTDTFTGWGDWGENPGRSIFNSWSGNPLYFDLIPLLGENTPPSITGLLVNPNPAEPGETVSFEVSAYDPDSDPLVVTIEYGDGEIGVDTTAGGTPSTQTAYFSHAYGTPGLYSVRIWANDSYGPATNNDTEYCENRVVVCADGELSVLIDPSPVVVGAGDSIILDMGISFPYASEHEFSDAMFFWYVEPSSLGSFDYRARNWTCFTAAPWSGSGNISCDFTYFEIDLTATAPVTVELASLSWVSVTPAAAMMQPGASRDFTAQAYDVLGMPMSGLEYAWTVDGMAPGDFTLSSSVGQTVTFSPLVEGVAWLNATTTDGSVTATGSAEVTSSYTVTTKEVGYLWYDMFNVPFGEWWDYRAQVYGYDVPLSYEYPYLFKSYGYPSGREHTYSNMRLDVSATNLTEINMVDNPEFLPLHGYGSGGNAVIDWYMQYLTSEEMERFPDATAAWYDGWVISLNGTVTLDEDAALSVLKGLTPEDFDDFSNWWTMNGSAVRWDFFNWFKSEAGKDRLDIFPMYDYMFTTLAWNLDAVKIGESVVLEYDLVTWGMDALMARWLHEAFVPTEWWFEDFSMHAEISPVMTDLHIDTAVAYAVHAWESFDDPGEPCWVWEAMLGDCIESYPPENKESEFNPYAEETYWDLSPGSYWYDEWVPYDYTPGAWNLSQGETIRLEWPSGDQMFKVHIGPGEVLNFTSGMVVDYAMPMESDNPELAPGSVSIDNIARTVTFDGPIDMWNWSYNQDSHPELADEWDRLGLLPWGVPYIEFSPTLSESLLFLDISGVPDNPVLETPVAMTVSVLDYMGMVYEDYRGTVEFSSDRPEVSLPADYTFKPGDHGIHTFDPGLTFHDTGWFLITCSDVDNSSVIAAMIFVEVLSEEPVLDHFVLEIVPYIPLMAGMEANLKVTACDQFGAILDDYIGTVTFVTDAPVGTYTLPDDCTFNLSDAGVVTLPGLMFNEPGTYEIVVYDTLDPLSFGSVVTVVSQSAQINYRLYDMFEQPWGEWWAYRLTAYRTDIILNNEPGAYTMVYNPDGRGRQGIIMAPYRWNVTATGLSSVNVSNPAVMPTFGPQVEGASAHLDIYFEYLYQDWWDNYWLPTWSTNPGWNSAIANLIVQQESDGYYLGVVYEARMNREAAETWMNMPQAADPITWWAANGDDYITSWVDWLEYQGNVEFDIYPGYEWPLVDLGTLMDLEVDGDDIVLNVGHFSWGYEVLITRWITDRAICTHQPYMEDFQLSAQFEESYGDLTYDAVAQYNLHAVKANQTESDAAWVWEPQHIDYITWEGSEFIPWEGLTYTSWNSGDYYFGQEVPYDFTPSYFNLTSYMSLTIQLPMGDVIGYRGLPTPLGSIAALKIGDDSAYEAIEVCGRIWLGWHGYPQVAGAPNLALMYNDLTRTLSIGGPMDFENYHHLTGQLYHSAPWIEFNVANGTIADLPPVAEAGLNRTVLGGELVILDGSGSYDDFGIVNWTWAFWYDGAWTEIYGPYPEFTFWLEGVYEITLMVTDAMGQSGYDTVTITVSGFIPEFGSVALTAVASVVVVALIASATRRRRLG